MSASTTERQRKEQTKKRTRRPLPRRVLGFGLSLTLGLAALSPALGLTQTQDSAPADDSAPPEDRPPTADGEPTGASVLDGVFTARQASKGKQGFQQVCAACHKPDEFSGDKFRLAWANRTVADLYAWIATTMPEANPGSLSPQDYTDIVAYLLDLNGYPAGDQELPADAGALQNVLIKAAPSP